MSSIGWSLSLIHSANGPPFLRASGLYGSRTEKPCYYRQSFDGRTATQGMNLTGFPRNCSLRAIPKIPFHEFSWFSVSSSLPLLMLILTIFHSRPDCWCWPKEARSLKSRFSISCSLYWNNEKGRSLSRLLLIIGKFPLF